jgi:murein DD-endopeptidase MepM/ murein hydrolase activator NlpD
MERASKRGLCLWFVVPSTGGVRRVRISAPFLFAILAVCGTLVGLAGCMAVDYVQVVWRQASDTYAVHRLSTERAALLAHRNALQEELIRVKSESAGSAAFKQNMNKKLDELFAVIEASTGMGPSRRVAIAPKGRSRTAESVLPPPERAEGAKTVLADAKPAAGEKLRRINRALGGAEVECRRERSGKVVCVSSVRKQNVSLGEVEETMKPSVIHADGESWGSADADLEARLDEYLRLVRGLPIGWPALGELTSGFGYRVSPFTGRASLHEGLDVSLPSGTKVRATGAGVVERVEWDGAYGLVVDIRHFDDVISRYAHLSRATVRQGEKVTRGQAVGLSGSTGRSTGPHLHYEVRYRGRARNPKSYIALAGKLNRFLS